MSKIFGQIKSFARWILLSEFGDIASDVKNERRKATTGNLWYSDRIDRHSSSLITYVESEEERTKDSWRNPFLLIPLLQAFWHQYLLLAIYKLVRIGLHHIAFHLSTQAMKMIHDNAHQERTAHEVWIVSWFIVASLLIAIVVSHQRLYQNRLQLRLRNSLCGLFYNRIIHRNHKLSSIQNWYRQVQKRTPIAPIPNVQDLLGVDIGELETLPTTITDVVTLPFDIYSGYLRLKLLIGPSIAVNVILAQLLATVTASILEFICAWYKFPYMRKRDVRLDVSNNVFRQILPIRMMGWEPSIEKLLEVLRRNEVSFLWYIGWLKCASNVIMILSFSFLRFLCFSTAVSYEGSSGNVMTPAVAIQIIGTLYSLQRPYNLIPYSVERISSAFVSLSRISSFVFVAKGPQPDVPKFLEPKARHSQIEEKLEIDIQEMNFGWNRDPRESVEPSKTIEEIMTFQKTRKAIRFADQEFHLSDVSFTLSRGECLIVCSPISGQGVSSFFQALLGEMHRRHTSDPTSRDWVRSRVEGKPIGYHQQIPWVPCGSAKGSVLLNRQYNDKRYQTIIAATALWEDFQTWNEGDGRWLSEGGPELSGGQKARLSLARALYGFTHSKFPNIKEASQLFLLDDPFSAIDVQMTSSIMSDLWGNGGLMEECASVVSLKSRDLPVINQLIKNSNVNFQILEIHENKCIFHNEIPGHLLQEDQKVVEVSSSANLLKRSLEEKSDTQKVLKAKNDGEFMQKGAVGRSDYSFYFKSVGTYAILSVIFLTAATESLKVFESIWLVRWARRADNPDEIEAENQLAIAAEEERIKLEDKIALKEELKKIQRRRIRDQKSGSFLEKFSALEPDVPLENFEDEIEFASPVDEEWSKKENNTVYSASIEENFVLEIDENDIEELLQSAWYAEKVREATDLDEEEKRLVRNQLKKLQPFCSNPSSGMSETPYNTFECDVSRVAPTYIGQSFIEFPGFSQLSLESFQRVDYFSGSFQGLARVLGFTTFGFVLLFALKTQIKINGAKQLHRMMVFCLLRAPMTFFYNNNASNILNRLNSDLKTVEDMIYYVSSSLSSLLIFVFSLMLLVISAPSNIPVVILLLAAIFLYYYPLFQPTNRQLQRESRATNSGLLEIFTEAYEGSVSIRAFKGQKGFFEKQKSILNEASIPIFQKEGLNAWLTLQLSVVLMPLTVLNWAIPIYLNFFGFGFLQGFFRTNFQTMSFMPTFYMLGMEASNRLPEMAKLLLWKLSLSESKMISLQRIKEYTPMECDPPIAIPSASILSKIPFFAPPIGSKSSMVLPLEASSEIVLSQVSFAYKKSVFVNGESRDTETPVFKKMTLNANTGDKIAVIGRSGSGKSTLMQLLGGIVKPTEGTITLNGKIIHSLHGFVRREIIQYIPQNHVAIEGWTMKKYLDPFDRYTDKECYKALHAVDLEEIVKNLPGQLGIYSVLTPTETDQIGDETEKRGLFQVDFLIYIFFKFQPSNFASCQLPDAFCMLLGLACSL
eukprot:GHVP01053554.1.p1 GENE.GHVP01053554.1~~GHVP01053554.1.p1  ORF type:complete len:1494 (-),score=253.87 GHVP01053554.1:345-4826(-)